MALDKLNGEILKINKGLESLKPNHVLDVADLSEDIANNLIELYKRKYFVRGPSLDKEHSKESEPKYVFAIMRYSFGGNQNA